MSMETKVQNTNSIPGFTIHSSIAPLAGIIADSPRTKHKQ